MYVAKGLDPELAREVARQLSRDPDRRSTCTSARSSGSTEDDLPSAPAGRRLVVRCPSRSARCCPSCPTCSARPRCCRRWCSRVAGLFLCGAFVTRLTPRPWWYGGLRQTAVGAVAAAVTYGVGSLVGASGLA